MGKIVITKKIAKQGRNNIIVIPSYLKNYLKHGKIVQIEITELKDSSQNSNIQINKKNQNKKV